MKIWTRETIQALREGDGDKNAIGFQGGADVAVGGRARFFLALGANLDNLIDVFSLGLGLRARM